MTTVAEALRELAALRVVKRAFTAGQRKTMASAGAAMPDGSYPIATEADLHNAIAAYGRAPDAKRAAVRGHIMRRARALRLADLIPAAWAKTTKALIGPGMSTSAMVAFYPSPDVADALALPGGYAADDLHVTLAFLGSDAVVEHDRSVIEAALALFALAAAPLLGSVSGIGRFTPDVPPGQGAQGDGEWPLVALVDVPELPEFRQRLVALLEGFDIDVAENHGFCPHCTLAMIGPADEYAAGQILAAGIDAVPLEFGSIVLAWGEDRTEFALTGAGFDDDEEDPEDADMDAGPSFAYAAKVAKMARTPVIKADPVLRYTFAPFYPASPDAPTLDDLDAHDELATPEDLRKAMWGYVRSDDRTVRLQHLDGTVIGERMDVVQWPYPVTMPLSLPDGSTVTKTFAPGSVFVGTVWTELGWELVEQGLITGHSLGGTARRVDVDLAA